MSQATALFSTDDDDRDGANFFLVNNPSDALKRVLDAIAVHRFMEASMEKVSMEVHNAAENAMDREIDAFLSRTPRTVRDILEMIDVIARDNCWHTTHSEEVPTRLDLLITTLRSAPNALADHHTMWDCGPRSYVIKIEADQHVPGIRVGDALVIDPDRAPLPDSIVLAADADNKPLVTIFAKIPAGGRLIGVATEHDRKL